MLFRERHSTQRDWGCGIALHNGHWGNGMRYHASRGHHGSAANYNFGENDDTGPNEGVLFYLDALQFLEMGNDRDPHANKAAVLDENEFRARGVEDGIVADHYAVPNMHAARTVQPNSKGSCSRYDSRQVLQYTVLDAP
jgi:hypothetical protein